MYICAYACVCMLCVYHCRVLLPIGGVALVKVAGPPAVNWTAAGMRNVERAWWRVGEKREREKRGKKRLTVGLCPLLWPKTFLWMRRELEMTVKWTESSSPPTCKMTQLWTYNCVRTGSWLSDADLLWTRAEWWLGLLWRWPRTHRLPPRTNEMWEAEKKKILNEGRLH